MMDIFICLVGGFILGYLLGVRVTKHKVLTMLEKLKKDYLNGV
jgi:uncharacterized protein YneF (UPF0154 family)